MNLTEKQQRVFTKPSQVPSVLGISRSTALRLEAKDSSFPRRRKVSPGQTAYLTAELLAWASSREKVQE